MPPRYSYWTIIAGGLPTAFRAAERDEILPVFARLKEKHPDAELKWFARGKLWDSPAAAREDTEARRRPPAETRGREWRPGGAHRDPRQKFKDAKKDRNQRWRTEKFEKRTASAKSLGGPGRRAQDVGETNPRAERPKRFERPGRPPRFERPERPERPGRFERPERPSGPSGQRPPHAGKPGAPKRPGFKAGGFKGGRFKSGGFKSGGKSGGFKGPGARGRGPSGRGPGGRGPGGRGPGGRGPGGRGSGGRGGPRR